MGVDPITERVRGVALTAVLLAAASGVACAGAPLADGPAGPPPSYRALRRVVLVRGPDGPGARAKDPLDAVRESLEADGRTTRTVDIRSRLPRELRGAARLYSDVEARLDDTPGTDYRGRRLGRVGGAAAILDELQADGAILYYRFVPRPLAPPPLGGAFGGRPDLRLPRPQAALAVVDRDGNLMWFDWGAPDTADRDPGAPSTAAEAVDALLRVLRGDQDDGSGA